MTKKIKLHKTTTNKDFDPLNLDHSRLECPSHYIDIHDYEKCEITKDICNFEKDFRDCRTRNEKTNQQITDFLTIKKRD